MLALLGDERNFEYGKWGDGYNRLVADRDYTAGQYDSEWGRDYGMYESDRTLAQDEHTNQEGYNYQNYRDAIADEQWQKNYELSERELAMAEDAYEIEKKEAGYPSKYAEEEEVPKKIDKTYYIDWTAGDWNSYFARIRLTEGQAAAEEELELFTSQGVIPTNFVASAAIGARGKLGH